MTDRKAVVAGARRVVLKIGTSTITDSSGYLDRHRLENLVRQVAQQRMAGRDMVVVTSGAIGAGAVRLGLRARPRTIAEKQAAAAVGQGLLMHTYEEAFARYGQVVAQVLLTRDDVMDRKRYLNARNTLLHLLRLGVVPVINENDTVAVDEIRFGDNDTLSALVAGLVDADLLFLLSDIDGLYTADPRREPGASRIPTVGRIDGGIESYAVDTGNWQGTGGMVTKVAAARIATRSGIAMVIAGGTEEDVVARVLAGEELGTVFLPAPDRLKSRQNWLAFGSRVRGVLVVDDGARDAIVVHGKSLLPSGVLGVEGKFDVGNTVAVHDREGQEMARGIVNYPAADVRRIMGHHSAEIEGILGYRYADEVIHRDNMVLVWARTNPEPGSGRAAGAKAGSAPGRGGRTKKGSIV